MAEQVERVQREIRFRAVLCHRLRESQLRTGITRGVCAACELALNALDTYIASRRKARLPDDEDDEAAWYNIACYKAVLAGRIPAQADKLKAEAIDALKKALEIAKAGGENQLRGRISKSEEDTDLKGLRDTPEFAELFEAFRPAAKTGAPQGAAAHQQTHKKSETPQLPVSLFP